MTNAEIVCVDGVNGIEAIVIRYARTGRLYAVNASAFLPCDHGYVAFQEPLLLRNDD